MRTVAPPFTLRHGTSQWYPVPQWLLMAWDLDKQDWREFALARMFTNLDALDDERDIVMR